MKAILEFDLPDDREDFDTAKDGWRWKSLAQEYANWLRGICKHGNPDEYNAEKCRDKFHEFLQEECLAL